MVKVQHQLNKTRITKFVQTQTRQASNYGYEEKSNEDGSNEKGSQEQAKDEANEEEFFKRFDVLTVAMKKPVKKAALKKGRVLTRAESVAMAKGRQAGFGTEFKGAYNLMKDGNVTPRVRSGFGASTRMTNYDKKEELERSRQQVKPGTPSGRSGSDWRTGPTGMGATLPRRNSSAQGGKFVPKKKVVAKGKKY